ncbi:unnamed protein product [Cyclocybe aegerita]|uniref:Uncharacterized protein n=1 Tax=Cyclocybe aegerita TaxID=1973307 RepID=A0A8S0VR85_CYCAE|nr:unnamed protein product [Cyclocybe aegerita]
MLLQCPCVGHHDAYVIPFSPSTLYTPHTTSSTRSGTRSSTNFSPFPPIPTNSSPTLGPFNTSVSPTTSAASRPAIPPLIRITLPWLDFSTPSCAIFPLRDFFRATDTSSSFGLSTTVRNGIPSANSPLVASVVATNHGDGSIELADGRKM